MPRYYFHLFNDMQIPDAEGIELPNDSVALERAQSAAREMAAESVRQGRLVLNHRIEVTDESGKSVGVVHFGDAVLIKDRESGANSSG